ncbi:MAG: right-handed parallel beta-helix repeat-containing protein [Thermoplasmata archaeon]|nr:MAG: right-handed parallel beta-helix repeat-containing protein [Thermoplasmata archaeon]
MNLMGRIINVTICLMLLTTIYVVTVPDEVRAVQTWYVDDVAGSSGPDDPPEDFTSIQSAIDAASDGDTIYVYSGIYYERIVIYRELTLEGEDKETTIIDSQGGGGAVKIIADWVNVRHFTIRNGEQGLFITSSHVNIEDNIVEDFGWRAISFHTSMDNNIIGNTVSSSNYGIIFSSSFDSIIAGNTITDTSYGLLSILSSQNTIENNNLSSNTIYGLCLQGHSYNDVIGNDIWNNPIGINMDLSASAFMEGNYVSMSTRGINIYSYFAPTTPFITGNDITHNDYGIIMNAHMSLCAPTITGNSINDNIYAIKVGDDCTPIIFNNEIINNDFGINYDPSSGLVVGNTIANNIYGIYAIDSDPTIIDNYIFNNDCGIYLDHSSPSIDSNTITNNIIGIYCINDSNPTLTNNIFSDNVFKMNPLILEIEITPETLNLKSKGRWINCRIELPDILDATYIDISTIKISDINGNPLNIPAAYHPTGAGIGTSSLIVKFDRLMVEDYITPGDAEISITGEFIHGFIFEGSDSIRVI